MIAMIVHRTADMVQKHTGDAHFGTNRYKLVADGEKIGGTRGDVTLKSLPGLRDTLCSWTLLLRFVLYP
jgi:hypothetical protein